MKDFLVLVTRCKDEPFIGNFVTHYLSEGVDCIHILDDGSTLPFPKHVLEDSRVKVHWKDNIIHEKYINTFYQTLRFKAEWLIYVDVDEYVTTRKSRFGNIRKELETTFKDADCIKIPWVMMSCNSRVNNPKHLLLDNVHRWNHDKKHENKISKIHKFRCRYEKIEIKCIFKPDKFDEIWDHHPREANTLINCVDGVYAKKAELNPYYLNLREQDIRNAHLVCYHYRIISIENSKSKIETNVWYKDYSVDDLMSNDHPEIIDKTLKRKVLLRRLSSLFKL